MAKEEKKFTKITLKDSSGRSYTLGYTRNTIRQMERKGFKLDTDYPYSMVTDLFRGAFLMNKYRLDNQAIDDIWNAQNHKEDLLTALITLYNAPMEELMADSEEDENPTWETA